MFGKINKICRNLELDFAEDNFFSTFHHEQWFFISITPAIHATIGSTRPKVRHNGVYTSRGINGTGASTSRLGCCFEIVDVGSYIYITAMMMCTTDINNQPYSQLIPFSCAKSVYCWLMGDRVSNIQVNIYLTQLQVRPLSVLLAVIIKLYCPITCYELRQWVLFVNCRWMSQKTVDDKTALVRVMAWCHQGPLLLTWFNFNPSMDK